LVIKQTSEKLGYSLNLSIGPFFLMTQFIPWAYRLRDSANFVKLQTLRILQVSLIGTIQN
jgi:predicted transporter